MAQEPSGAHSDEASDTDTSSTIDIYRIILQAEFRKAAAQGLVLNIDAAVSGMWGQIQKLFPNPPSPRSLAKIPRQSQKAHVAELRQIYHCAVDVFFKTYYPDESKRGRPKLPEEDLLRVQELHEHRLSFGEIAHKLQDPKGPEARDKYRKRFAIAKKRLPPSGKNSPN